MSGFIRDCLARRVPQYVGAYLVLVWGLVQFVSFIEDRYRIAGPLVEVVALLMVLLLPTVVILAWSQGRPGRDRWTRRQLATMLGNAAVAVLVLYGLFRGEEIGAVTRKIEVVDENGVRSEREVPDTQSIQRLAAFPFVADPSLGDDSWLAWGVPEMLCMDLYQALFLDLRPPLALADLYRGDGFSVGRVVPRGKLIEVAAEQHCDWLMTGTISRSGSDYKIATELLSAKTAAVVSSHVLEGPDPFALLDQITRLVWKDTNIPSWYLDDLTDLPVSEMHTADEIALREYFLGEMDFFIRNDLPSAAQRLDAAVDRDPSFALAQTLRFAAHSFLQNVDVATAALRAAIEHEYRLPERARFTVRTAFYLNIERDPARALAVGEMWAQLYPNDLDALRILAQLRMIRGERQELVSVLGRILDIDPDNADTLDQLGRAQMGGGDFAGAEATFRRYAEINPKDWRSHFQIGDLYVRQSRFEEALEAFDRASLLDESNIEIRLRKATVQERLGQFGAARKSRELALAACRSGEDSLATYVDLRDTDRLLGQYEAVLALQKTWESLAREVYNPTELAARLVGSLEIYTECGRVTEGRRLLQRVERSLDQSSRIVVSLGEGWLRTGEEDWDGALESCADLEAFANEFRIDAYRRQAALLRARIAMERGEPERAVELFTALDAERPGSRQVLRELGRSLRAAGDNARSLERLDECLALHPYDPQTHVELGRTHLALGNTEKGRAHLEAALEIWSDADPGYDRVEEAQTLLRGVISTPRSS